MALLYECVAVADTAGLNFNPYTPGHRLRDLTLDQLERSACGRNLNCTHLGHIPLQFEFMVPLY
jgi:hypothetical protein